MPCQKVDAMIAPRETPDHGLLKLAACWDAAHAPASPDLLAATQEAFASLTPDCPHALAPLLDALDRAASRPDTRAIARNAFASFLDRIRRRAFTEALPSALVPQWTSLAVRAVDSGDYTVHSLLRSREQSDPDVIALQLLGPDPCRLTVADVARRTRAIARGLLSLLDANDPGTVAILSENGLETALCDLACLANGIVNVRVPANAVPDHVEYILRHSDARVLVVSNDEHLAKVLPSLGALPALRSIVVVDPAAASRHGLLTLAQLVAQAADTDDAPRAARADATRSGDLATVMYTSGTSGLPKGISFSQRNIVTKRFCRGFALPRLGEGDVFLSYLPLFHTFGRWFELLGTLHWGATYVFARSPSQVSLLEDFQEVSPTVFISVPKKWMELHERAVTLAGTDAPKDVADQLRIITGGRLRFGVSAAGYLDPLVFRAVQRAGVSICSGYGMTESTGGITMTPPGAYRDGSIGVALPGIELATAEDNELRIRGPYVMMGYFNPPDGVSGLDENGWFSTGDIVSRDDDGHIQIVDRKKEIYKNRKGQTIVPQRVENLFRDFDAVGQAFLVGDHREYNTLLLWPNSERQPGLASRSPAEVHALLESLVVSANRFLARYERVVAFAILPRALSEEHGELTPKGTFKRKIVEENWRSLIEPMYLERHASLDADGLALHIPNWVLREIGVVRSQLALHDGLLRALDRDLSVRRMPSPEDALRIGDFVYTVIDRTVDLGEVLSNPSIWVGNDALRTFIGDETFATLLSKERPQSTRITLALADQEAPAGERLRELAASLDAPEITPQSVHAAAVLLRGPEPEALRAVAHLQRAIGHARSDLASLCRSVLRRGAARGSDSVRCASFRALLAEETESELIASVRAFLATGGEALLRHEDFEALSQRGLPDAHVRQLIAVLSQHARIGAPRDVDATERTLICGLIRILGAYASADLAWYASVRFPLARLTLHGDPGVAARAGEELDRLLLGFRSRIGPNLRLATDPATGNEYGWADVTVFDDNVTNTHRDAILRAIIETSLVRESTFIFGKGVLLSLSDVAPSGVWVSHLGTEHGKSVYRLSVQTRHRGVFDIALNLAETLPVAELREEIRWLMSAGDQPPLVEEFGGYFPEHGLFTEEFIPGETVDRQLARLTRQGATDRVRANWPFLVWNALRAHADFWDRTGRKIALATPAPSNIIVPSHDYQTGARLVSVSSRSPCSSVADLFDRFRTAFLEPLQAIYPDLQGRVPSSLLFSAFVEPLGLERGLSLLREVQGDLAPACRTFLTDTDAHGFTPQRLYFAVQRYARWLDVNPSATVEARGQMLQELWDTYALEDIEAIYPDARVRFFRQTVFNTSPAPLLDELDRLMVHLGQSRPDAGKLVELVAALRARAKPTTDEDWFLARLTYPHLRPGDQASLITLQSGATRLVDVEVALFDADGTRFRVRGPVSPREEARLLTLFHEANLTVTFAPEHEFLLAINDDDQVIGGLFYGGVSKDRAHLEKIVVAHKHRRKGLSDGLMAEFMRRLRSRGVRSVVAGFFRPEYLRRFGFHPEPFFSGLVRDLTTEPIGRADTPL